MYQIVDQVVAALVAELEVVLRQTIAQRASLEGKDRTDLVAVDPAVVAENDLISGHTIDNVAGRTKAAVARNHAIDIDGDRRQRIEDCLLIGTAGTADDDVGVDSSVDRVKTAVPRIG